MDKKSYTVDIGSGLGPIKFGMARHDVKAIIGEADEVDEYSYSDSEEDLTVAWHFDEHEVSMSFDEEMDWKLSTLAVSSEDFLMEGNKVVGLSKAELIDLIEKLKFADIEIVDDKDSYLISSNKNAVNFWLEDGVVSEVQWSPMLNEDETVRWP